MEARKKRSIPGKLLLCLLFSGVLVMCLEMGLSMLRPEAPGSPARHAALWAACVGLLAAGTLLVVFWQPAAKAWQWAEDRIMNPETRKPWIDIALAIAAGAMLLHHFYVILYYPVIPAGATKLTPVWIVLAAMTAVLGRSWRDWGTRIGTLLLVFMFERFYINKTGISGKDILYFSSGIYAAFICFGLFFAVRPAVWKPFLKIMCSIWVLCGLGLCFAGLYTAWTGTVVHNLVDEPVYGLRGRLFIFSNPDISGGWIACCIAFAVVGLIVCGNKMIKAFHLLAVCVAAVTLSLTDARSSFMMTAFLVAGACCLGLVGKWNKSYKMGTRGGWIKICFLLLLCFILCFILVVEAESHLTDLFMKIRTQGKMIIPTAAAEENEFASIILKKASTPALYTRRETWASDTADINHVLTGRVAIWQNALRYLTENRQLLLYGMSVDGSVAEVVNQGEHLHNYLIQITLEGGIPALLLYLGLLLYFFIHACRLWKRWQLPLWQRVLPVPVLAILLQEMAECLTHFSFGHPPMTVLWFFMGCTVAVSRQALVEEAGKTAGASLTRGTTGG